MKSLLSNLVIGLVAFATSVLLTGCATAPSVRRMQSDPGFQQAAIRLVSNYLDAQKSGESGGARFGSGAANFYNLAEYRVVSTGWEWGAPAVFVRVKAGNKIGGNPVWTDYATQLRHDPRLEATGDVYLGLRISMVGPSIVRF